MAAVVVVEWWRLLRLECSLREFACPPHTGAERERCFGRGGGRVRIDHIPAAVLHHLKTAIGEQRVSLKIVCVQNVLHHQAMYLRCIFV